MLSRVCLVPALIVCTINQIVEIFIDNSNNKDILIQ